MAWRIDENVVRGEIDNRVRGRVTGRLWLAGRTEAVELDFAGNAWRDLAGRRLTFINPAPKPAALEGFTARQSGVIGDCTASRKVKVPDIPFDQISEYYAARKPFPWHWGNSLYFEWFSSTNGRVVIESAAYQLVIGTDCAWEMTQADEEEQRRANAGALTGFMDRLREVTETAGSGVVDEAPDEGCAPPQTEAEAEQIQEESDRLADRISARVEREGVEGYETIIEEEMERRRQERGDPPLTPQEAEERDRWLDEMNRAADEALSKADHELEAELGPQHPLAEAAFDLASRLLDEPEGRGWIPASATTEHPVVDLIRSAMCASAKLAGALNTQAWPPRVDACATTIVGLKRARGFYEDALQAAEACAEENLTEPAWLAEVRREIEAMARECDRLIGTLRELLRRGSG